jgi:hypothetical protein
VGYTWLEEFATAVFMRFQVQALQCDSRLHLPNYILELVGQGPACGKDSYLQVASKFIEINASANELN